MFIYRKMLAVAMCAASWIALPAFGSNIHDVVQALEGVRCYRADVRLSVSMPQLAEDVVYDLTLNQMPATAERLSPSDYLIESTLRGVDQNADGFSAFFGGHHYRYSGQRLQEYHMEWDSIPFIPDALEHTKTPGVQRTAQFVSYLPAFLAETLRSVMADDRYRVIVHPDTTISGVRRLVVDTELVIASTTAAEAEYTFDHTTLMPVRIVLENNPGSISEQTIYVDYSATDLSNRCEPLSEEMLIERFPNVFELYRESNFRIENLPGMQLPAFALPTPTGERYSRRAADGFRALTVVALLDPSTAFTSQVIADLRSAIDIAPVPVDAIWAFTSTNADAIEAVVGSLREGEHALMNARGLARDCGAAELPVILVVDRQGVVKDIILGYNQTLAEDVIQKIALMSR